MTRMSLLLGVLTLVLPALVGLTGCRSWDRGGSGGGGCGGGCCRGVNPDTQARTGAKTCPVSGEELGSMGEPVSVNIKGRTVLVCCEGCAEQLKRNPERYLAGANTPGQP